jgi:hypothetical protein
MNVKRVTDLVGGDVIVAPGGNPTEIHVIDAWQSASRPEAWCVSAGLGAPIYFHEDAWVVVR